MCGIVGGVAERDIAPILLEGLKRLEYRGYDSAGIAVIDKANHIHCNRTVGKVSDLAELLSAHALPGKIGIAHTRWATHGIPHERNAHPIMSHDSVAIVHNGIIENHEELRRSLIAKGYHFHSETDSETVAHQLHYFLGQGIDPLSALKQLRSLLRGAYALGILLNNMPDRLFAIRSGCPLVIGLGIGENFIASDQLALLPVTQKFIFLGEDDLAEVSAKEIKIIDAYGNFVERIPFQTEISIESIERGQFRHFMLKEIFDQPSAVGLTIREHFPIREQLDEGLYQKIKSYLPEVQRMQIIAAGTSYYAGLVAKYWLESIARINCQVEIASELRYRYAVVEPGTLLICISQSGETLDTLAALRDCKQSGSYLASFGICNVAESALAREVDVTILTRAGIEIGVASTKAFTTQLVVLLQLAILFARERGLSSNVIHQLVEELYLLPNQLEKVLLLDQRIRAIAEGFADHHNALFIARNQLFPIALEGALKLKEISYIHAEGYPAGELKHGPLALVDHEMPVVVIAPHDQLLEKLKGNIQEVKARGGEVLIFAQHAEDFNEFVGVKVVPINADGQYTAPIIFTLPLQLLAYYVALFKGTDVDQPRNLAKSVTVE